ncbi:LuxR C-terminal-related transcriptional regulator [Halomonas sp. BM-2019]|uniref:helix-turn-helix transcriptional regulator n=1 Tax=Halomonas sp. BM-2019 TaxID=2811227 RepID=UPI001B3C4275|nr:MAG: helix-turn-helix transcriptional regulator [Halomonas sp. BM-2019]
MTKPDAAASDDLLGAFSQLLWDLNRLAQEQPLPDFHPAALARLQELLAFDCAWWGRTALVDSQIEEHSRYLFELPEAYLADWRAIEHQDVTVERAHRQPGQAVIVDMRATTPGLAWLGERHGLGELLCVIHTNPRTRLSDHLSLYRRPGSPRFGERERRLLTHLIAHLSAAVDASQIRTLVARREHLESQQHLALAVCDRQGVLHSAERGFSDLLCDEWPDWQGPRLPVDLDETGYQGERVHIQCRPVLDLWLLTVCRLGPLACLSDRELVVAQHFGVGLTYKEIARELAIAPSTVRHHLRSIYQKLGVHDKASIATLVDRSPPG